MGNLVFSVIWITLDVSGKYVVGTNKSLLMELKRRNCMKVFFFGHFCRSWYRSLRRSMRMEINLIPSEKKSVNIITNFFCIVINVVGGIIDIILTIIVTIMSTIGFIIVFLSMITFLLFPIYLLSFLSFMNTGTFLILIVFLCACVIVNFYWMGYQACDCFEICEVQIVTSTGEKIIEKINRNVYLKELNIYLKEHKRICSICGGEGYIITGTYTYRGKHMESVSVSERGDMIDAMVDDDYDSVEDIREKCLKCYGTGVI